MKEGMFLKENKFFVEGEGNIKYTYNNGHLANDPKLAVGYFLHALEKIPMLIEKYEKETAKLSTDLPVLQEVVGSVWRKEDELKGVKSELAALDRKIQLSLRPVEKGEVKREEKGEKEEKGEGKAEKADATIVAVEDAISKQLQEAKKVMKENLLLGHVKTNPRGMML
jgi:hypothetical protein